MDKKPVLALVLLLSILFITACGSNETQVSESSKIGVGSERPMRMALVGAPNVDPATGSNWAATYIYSNIYDSLVMYDINGKIVPLLAEDWEIADDGTSYTFNLKKNVKFHDGSQLTASDVVFSLNRIIAMQQGFSYMFVDTVEKAEAIDDYTVKFELKKPTGTFIDSLCRLYILNEDLIMNNLNMNHDIYRYGEYGDYGISYLLTNDAGSGPYMFRELSPQNYLIADQFEDYHIPFSENAPTYIQFINNTEATTIRTMLANRELEISDNWQTAESIASMEKIDGVSIAQYGNSATQQIAFNCSKAPTDDKYFRKALACLIDYDAIVESIFPGSTCAIGPAGANTPGAGTQHDENPYKFDIEKAKEYLALSKYANQLDEYPVEFFSNSSVPSQEKIALALQAAAKQVGITIKITSAPYSNLVERVSNLESTPHIVTSSQCPYYYDAGCTFDSHYTSDNVGTTTNTFWILDNDLDQMISEALAIIDTKERYNAYANLEKHILDECYGAYIADITEKVAYQSEYVYWPAAEYFKNTGEMSHTCVGYHYWFHDFEVYPEKILK